MKERGLETIWILVYLSLFIPREGPPFTFTGKLMHIGPTI
jgi:hypothetical protein